MTTSRRDQTPAEYRATVEAAARTRLEEGKQALEVLREQELADAEALALARIRIQTDQMLAKQTEALRDADQKAQLTAIERRSADLEAVKQARRRLEMEEAAAQANLEKKAALEAAAEAARDKLAALAKLAAAAAEQRRTLGEMKTAAGKDKALRWQVRWLTLRTLSSWKAALAALAIGLAVGYGINAQPPEAALAGFASSASSLYEDAARGPAPQLRLDPELHSR